MSEAQPQLVRELSALLDSLVGKVNFGTVELTFHQGQLVQLEKREKVRFEKSVDPR